MIFSASRASPVRCHPLPAETLELIGGHFAKVPVQCVAGLDLLAVDQHRLGYRVRVAVIIEVSEQGKAPLLQGLGAVLVLTVEAGDIVIDQLRGRGVVADHYEAGRRRYSCLGPGFVGLHVVPIESLKGGLKLYRQTERVESPLRFAPALLGHVTADGLPQNSVLGHVAAWDVVSHRHAGQFDDAALDGVHEREVAHRPGKQGALGIAGASQEEGSR